MNNIPTEEEEYTAPVKGRKRISFLKYFILFCIVFGTALFILKGFVASHSPEVDVEIGDKDENSITDNFTDLEHHNIDERLKWIQMEDDIREISLIGQNREQREKLSEKPAKKEAEAQKPAQHPVPEPAKYKYAEIKPEAEHNTDFSKIQPAIPVYEAKKPKSEVKKDNEKENKKRSVEKKEEHETITIKKNDNAIISISMTKVYTGYYSTADEAVAVQQKMREKIPSIQPFVKNAGGKYIVQAGSFYDANKADALIIELRKAGFSPKKYVEK